MEKRRRWFICAECEGMHGAAMIAYVSPTGSTYCEGCVKLRADREQIARARGAEAGYEGLTPFDNPYEQGAEPMLRRQWEDMRRKVARDMGLSSSVVR